MNKLVLLTLLAFSAILPAQQTAKPAVVSPNGSEPKSAKPAEAAKPPVLTDAQKLKFFKAQAQSVIAGLKAKEADDEAQKKLDSLNSIAKELQDVCGKDYTLYIEGNDDDGNLTCHAKPAAPTAPTPEVKK